MSIRLILAVIMFLLMSGGLGYGADCIGKRYQDNGNGTVLDCRTGLVWLKDANCKVIFGEVSKNDEGFIDWFGAKKWAAGVSGFGDGTTCQPQDGSSPGDWRLPTKTELMAMLESAKMQGFTNPVLTDATGKAQGTDGNVFSNIHTDGYWTSNTDPTDTTRAWYVVVVNGSLGVSGKSFLNSGLVWPVRGGQTGSFGSVFVK